MHQNYTEILAKNIFLDWATIKAFHANYYDKENNVKLITAEIVQQIYVEIPTKNIILDWGTIKPFHANFYLRRKRTVKVITAENCAALDGYFEK